MINAKRTSRKITALSLAALSLMSGFPVSAAENNGTNTSGGQTKVEIINNYEYHVMLPASIDLKYNENGTSNPLYDAPYNVLFYGSAPGKTLYLETDNVDLQGDHNKYFVTNYLGDKTLASHIAIGTKDITSDKQTIEGYASMGANNVQPGQYAGVANFKFRLVDTGTTIDDIKNAIHFDESMVAMGAGASHQLTALDSENNDITDQVNFTSSDPSIATVTDGGKIVTSSSAKAGDQVTITAENPGTVDSSALLDSLKDAFGPMTVNAAEINQTGSTVSITVTIVDITFNDASNEPIDEISIYPGKTAKIKALVDPISDGIVTWSETRPSGVALTKHGNVCDITLASDMPAMDTFYVVATYGDYSKTIKVVTAHDHVAKDAVAENKVEPTHSAAGHYDSVVYCDVCGEEITRETIEIAATGHNPAAPVIENKVEATCTEAGHYDSVVYCKDDKEELSRETIKIPATGHDFGEWRESSTGYYVRYCKNDTDHKEVGEAIDYTISYDLDGGSISGQKTSYTVEDKDFTLPTPTKDGFKFTGWTGSNGTTAQETVTIKAGTTGNKKYVANWESEGPITSLESAYAYIDSILYTKFINAYLTSKPKLSSVVKYKESSSSSFYGKSHSYTIEASDIFKEFNYIDTLANMEKSDNNGIYANSNTSLINIKDMYIDNIVMTGVYECDQTGNIIDSTNLLKSYITQSGGIYSLENNYSSTQIEDLKKKNRVNFTFELYRREKLNTGTYLKITYAPCLLLNYQNNTSLWISYTSDKKVSPAYTYITVKRNQFTNLPKELIGSEQSTIVRVE